eukprot:scaffold146299_cov39-Tisochrysis_lutea.AAC.3
MNRTVDVSLPKPVKDPEPRELYAELTEQDRQIPGVYGHKLCCEPGYGSKGLIDTVQIGIQPITQTLKVGQSAPVQRFAGACGLPFLVVDEVGYEELLSCAHLRALMCKLTALPPPWLFRKGKSELVFRHILHFLETGVVG